MPKGRYGDTVWLQSLVEAEGADGNIVETWANDRKVSVAIRPLSARELMEAQAVQSKMTHRIYARYQAGITPSRRFVSVVDGTIYNISKPPINVEMHNRELEIECIQVVQ